ncbi:MAG TPA: hypothetical protein P5120_11975 [Spirochaetota bacterium]|nr:hypothetical protein [Spirochaetota bacterium]
MKEGPSLEAMLDRLAAIPGDFMREPGKKKKGEAGLQLTALINDLLLDTGDLPVSAGEIKTLENRNEEREYLRILSILCHLFHDPFFIKNRPDRGLIRKFLFSPKLEDLASCAGDAELFITDPDRREELCRLALNAVGLYPAGETEKRGRERLATLDSIERKKILDKTRQAQERAREIREAMLRKEAEEAASKMSRE